jgi:hypothetical protein
MAAAWLGLFTGGDVTGAAGGVLSKLATLPANDIRARIPTDPFWLFGLTDSYWRNPAAIPALMFSGFALLAVYFFCLVRAKRFEARPASEVLSEDTRAPVLYLRSFQDDSKAAWNLGMSLWGSNTEEGEIAEIVKSIGPLVAVGRPDEKLSFFGAARVYVVASDWKERVRGLLSQAPLVIARAGHTAGLSWELEQCAKIIRPEKLIILIPFDRRRYDEFRTEAKAFLPCPLPEYNVHRDFTLRNFYTIRYSRIRAILYFDSDWTPHLEPVIGVTLSFLRFMVLFIASAFGGGGPSEGSFWKDQSNLRLVLECALRPIIERPTGRPRRGSPH